MRTQSKWIIDLVYRLLTACWYINLVLAVIAFVALTLTFTTKDYTTMSMPAKLKGSHTTVSLQSASTAQSVTADYDQAVIKMRLKVTPSIVFEGYAFFAVIETLIMLVIFHLRKIFIAFRSEEPFQHIIVTRLRIVGLCLIVSTPVKAIWGWADYLTLKANVKDFNHQFMMIWSDNFTGIILGVLLYVIAEVFRYGIELKHENEAFV